MREILYFIRAGIRRSYKEFMGIVILAFLISAMLSLVLTVNGNTGLRHAEAMEEAGFQTIFAGFYESGLTEAGLSVTELTEQLAQADYVASVQSSAAFMAYIDYEGEESSNRVLLFSAKNTRLNYQVENESGRKPLFDVEIQKGEIYVPYSFQALCDAEIGDSVCLRGTEETFLVAGFFEDPLMGSSMMGIKTLLLSDEDWERLYEGTWNNDEVVGCHIVLVQKSEDCPWSDSIFERRLNEETGFEDYAGITLTKSQSQNYMLMMTRILAALLAVFVMLLAVVVLVVVGHSINSSIEMEYTNLGILKALGFTGGKLQTAMLIQYLLAAAVGVCLGMPASIPLIGLVNRVSLPMTCLVAPDKFAAAPCLLAGLCILAFIAVYIVLKLQKMKTVTPLRAIAEGREEIYFASRLQTGIYKKGMNVWLALRQLTAEGRQYLGAGIIAILLVFFLSIVSEISGWLGEDGERLQDLFCCNDRDFDIYYQNQELQPEVEALIEERAGIAGSYQSIQGYVMLNGSQTMCCVSDAPESYHTVYKGRTCLYDNEIIINEFLADELSVSIGDEVELSLAGKTEEFLISGYFEWGNDTGDNFAMNAAGYKRLTGELPQQMWYNYEVEEKEAADSLVAEIKELYSADELQINDRNIFKGVAVIVDAVHGIVYLIYAVAGIFVVVTVSLVCGKLFWRERKNYGIYRAVGFTNAALRRQFALRFLCVSLLGCAGGELLNLLFANSCAKILLSMIGCTGQGEQFITGFSVLFPCVFICGMFYLVSFWMASKIRKVKAGLLLVDKG